MSTSDSNTTAIVNPGTLVHVRELGVYLRAGFNEDDGGRPFVSIDTSELPAHWRYDEKTGVRADAEFADPYKNDDGSYVVFDADGTRAAVVYRLAGEFDLETRRRAEKLTAELAREWGERVGMPMLTVHLNDGAEIYDDRWHGSPEQVARLAKTAEGEST
jgi:hypothetical protein